MFKCRLVFLGGDWYMDTLLPALLPVGSNLSFDFQFPDDPKHHCTGFDIVSYDWVDSVPDVVQVYIEDDKIMIWDNDEYDRALLLLGFNTTGDHLSDKFKPRKPFKLRKT